MFHARWRGSRLSCAPVAAVTRQFRAAALLGILTWSALPSVAFAIPPKQDTRAQDAMALGRLALDYFMKKQFRTAAEMYRRAAQVDPATVDYMYGVARAEREEGRTPEAVAAYEEVLARTPPSHPLHVKAQYALAEIRSESPPSAAAPLPEAPLQAARAAPRTAAPDDAGGRVATVEPLAKKATVVSEGPLAAPLTPPLASGAALASPPPAQVAADTSPNGTTWRRPVMWAGFGIGAAGLVTGIVSTALAISDKSALNKKKLPDGRYDEDQVSPEQVNAAVKSINSEWAVAGVFTAVGLAATGVGVWLWLADREPTLALTPSLTGTGLALTGQF